MRTCRARWMACPSHCEQVGVPNRQFQVLERVEIGRSWSMTCALRLMSWRTRGMQDPQTVGRWVRGLGTSAMLDSIIQLAYFALDQVFGTRSFFSPDLVGRSRSRSRSCVTLKRSQTTWVCCRSRVPRLNSKAWLLVILGQPQALAGSFSTKVLAM